MERVGTLETVCRYPVKSMAGEELDAAFVGFAGMLGDRAYAFVRDPGPKGFPWHTGREQEDLVLYRPRYRDAVVAAAVPADVERSFEMAPGVNPVLPGPEAFAVEVVTPGGRTLPVDSPELRAELARRSGHAVALRFSERALYDCRPVSLFGNATAACLARELGAPVDRRRFRANLYADWDGGADGPFREDGLVGRTLQLGDRLRVAVLERDPRCKMITLDPDTGRQDPALLRHVNQAHGGTAGVYAAVLVEGVVRKGDPIWVV
jgi:uncharacterized protein YcbX